MDLRFYEKFNMKCIIINKMIIWKWKRNLVKTMGLPKINNVLLMKFFLSIVFCGANLSGYYLTLAGIWLAWLSISCLISNLVLDKMVALICFDSETSFRGAQEQIS